jgi:hypothetical protein
VEKQREDLDCRFNQAGGGADKQLVADGGPGADDAAQRVALRTGAGASSFFRFTQTARLQLKSYF